MVYGGLLDMLTPNRLRALQRLNEEVVGGSGVFYFNALWRQVRGMCLNVQAAIELCLLQAQELCTPCARY